MLTKAFHFNAKNCGKDAVISLLRLHRDISESFMALCHNCALTAHPQRLNVLLFIRCIYIATSITCCSGYRAFFAFLLRSLASKTRLQGVSSALSVRPQTLEHWLLYKSKRYSIIKLDIVEHIKRIRLTIILGPIQ